MTPAPAPRSRRKKPPSPEAVALSLVAWLFQASCTTVPRPTGGGDDDDDDDATGDDTASADDGSDDDTVPSDDDTTPASGEVDLTYPGADATLCGSVDVSATASDDTVTVEFWLDGDSQAVDGDAPWTWSWDTGTASAGAHTLRVTAQGASGWTAEDSVQVTVDNSEDDCDNPPSVVLTSPEADWVTGTAALAATATDDVGVVRVQFFIDAGLLAEDLSVPFQGEWDTAEFAEGTHSIRVVAYDTADHTGAFEADIGVDRTAPQVALTAPGDGETWDGPVTLAATASDAHSGVVQVTFYDGAVAVGSDTSAPYELVWDWGSLGVAPGAHTVTARAWDAVGLSKDDAVAVQLGATGPEVSIDSPGSTASGTVVVQVSATDPSGVSSVALSIDGDPWGTDTTAPYQFTWDTCDTGNGVHTLLATAVADDGGEGVATRGVTVGNTDADGDGYPAACGDCEDYDADAHPGATEACDNGVDDDCDGTPDDGCPSDDDYSGTWALDPVPHYSCVSGLLDVSPEVVAIDDGPSDFVMTVPYTLLALPYSFDLVGERIGTSFTAESVLGGLGGVDCEGGVSIEGFFSSDDTFAATLRIDTDGGVACLDCLDAFFVVAGERS